VFPDYLHCIGPVWFENWGKENIQEELCQRLWNKGFKANAEKLVNILGVIRGNLVRRALKVPARDLIRVIESQFLQEDSRFMPLEQSIFKSVGGNTWHVRPVF